MFWATSRLTLPPSTRSLMSRDNQGGKRDNQDGKFSDGVVFEPFGSDLTL